MKRNAVNKALRQRLIRAYHRKFFGISAQHGLKIQEMCRIVIDHACGKYTDATSKAGLISRAGKLAAQHFNTDPSSKRGHVPQKDEKGAFYASWEWRTLRTKILKKYGARCMCCGATPEHTDMNGNAVRIVVDHIKPLHHHWELRLEPGNLQVLCDECNQGKGAWDSTDHRGGKHVSEVQS